MRALVIVGVMAAALAGCQTVEQSSSEADYVCEAQGFRPGSQAYKRCWEANFRQNRRNSEATGAAIATGVAVGALAGAAVAASGPRYYRRGYYYSRCDAWGCW